MRKDNELLILINEYKRMKRRHEEMARYEAGIRKKLRIMPHNPLQGKFNDYLTTLTQGDERNAGSNSRERL